MNTEKIGSMTLDWDGPGFVDRVKSAAAIGLNEAAWTLRNITKRNIGIQGPPRSAPGMFPHMDTRTLANSLDISTASKDKLSAQMGVSKNSAYLSVVADYAELGRTGSAPRKITTADDVGLWLEFGTSRMAPRPWLVRSMTGARTQIVHQFIASAGMAFRAGYTEGKGADIR